MKTYKVVEDIEIEDYLFDTIIIGRGIESLKKAKKIADEYCEDYFNNLYKCQERDDGLDEYHRWRVYEENTNKKVYETF